MCIKATLGFLVPKLDIPSSSTAYFTTIIAAPQNKLGPLNSGIPINIFHATYPYPTHLPASKTKIIS